MRAVIQRVSEASVEIDEKEVSRIGRGFLVLLGISDDDTEGDADYLAAKTAGLRVFGDEQGKMNLPVQDVGGEVLVVSQFTLLGDCRKGKRPSFVKAAPPELAIPLYERYVERLRKAGISTETGEFQAMMDVKLINDGPVTLLLDSKKLF